MGFVDDTLAAPAAGQLADLDLPRRQSLLPLAGVLAGRGPLLPAGRPVQRRRGGRPAAARPHRPRPRPARRGRRRSRGAGTAGPRSGGDRWQGGTLTGVTSPSSTTCSDLGVTTLWLSPVFKQRGHLDTYHGYGIQDFLDVDPRFGTRRGPGRARRGRPTAGACGCMLDVIFNHSGANWLYPPGHAGRRAKPHYTAGRHPFGSWLRRPGPADRARSPVADDGVWPRELQDRDTYTRAGTGNLGAGDARRRPQPSTSAPTSRTCATSPWSSPGVAAADLARALQVLDRADRLRRLPHRHASST